jgi:hypothetical protein
MAKLREIDRRWIFLAVAVALVLTVAFPFDQPITPSPSVQSVYDYIERLPEGSAVLIATDYDPQAGAETVPITRALLRHCMRHNVRVIGMTFWNQGVQLAQGVFDGVAKECRKKAGADYVYLGYKPGTMAQIITNMGENFSSAFTEDSQGNRTANMPIFQQVRSLRDLKFIVDVAAGDTVSGWIVYGGDKYQVPMAAGCTAVSGPDLYVYANAGQLRGIIAGLRGAADYEALLSQPGRGIAGMSAQSTVHAIIVLFVVIANVIYFRARRAEKKAGNAQSGQQA